MRPLISVSGHLRSKFIFSVETREPHPSEPDGRRSSCRPHIPIGLHALARLDFCIRRSVVRIDEILQQPTWPSCCPCWCEMYPPLRTAGSKCRESRTQKDVVPGKRIADQAFTYGEDCSLLIVAAQISVSSLGFRLLSRKGPEERVHLGLPK